MNTNTNAARRIIRRDSPLRLKIDVELARHRMTKRDLAAKLAVSDTTLSGWLTGAHPYPPDLLTRIENALGMKRGALRA